MPKECSFFLISIETETKAIASSREEFYGSKKAGWYDPAFFAHRRKPEQKTKLHFRDDFHFAEHMLGQRFHRDTGARGAARHILAVDDIEGIKVVHAR